MLSTTYVANYDLLFNLIKKTSIHYSGFHASLSTLDVMLHWVLWISCFTEYSGFHAPLSTVEFMLLWVQWNSCFTEYCGIHAPLSTVEFMLHWVLWNSCFTEYFGNHTYLSIVEFMIPSLNIYKNWNTLPHNCACPKPGPKFTDHLCVQWY